MVMVKRSHGSRKLATCNAENIQWLESTTRCWRTLFRILIRTINECHHGREGARQNITGRAKCERRRRSDGSRLIVKSKTRSFRKLAPSSSLTSSSLYYSPWIFCPPPWCLNAVNFGWWDDHHRLEQLTSSSVGSSWQTLTLTKTLSESLTGGSLSFVGPFDLW